jgi:hypothetical protein
MEDEQQWMAFAAHVASYREGVQVTVLVPRGSDISMLHRRVGSLFGKNVRFAEAD